MKKIPSIFFILLFLALSPLSLDAMNYDETSTTLLNVIKNIDFKNSKKVFESLADFFIKEYVIEKGLPLDETWYLKKALLVHKDYIDTGVATFKQLPIEIRKTVYKIAQATKSALKKIKAEVDMSIKVHKATITEHEKNEKALTVLNKKNKKDDTAIQKLQETIDKNNEAYENAKKNLETIEKQYKNAHFDELEQWVNKLNSVAYWNSGAGFFEQFGLLNWSGKFLTIFGAPLACYGAYKIYHDFLLEDADDQESIESTVE